MRLVPAGEFTMGTDEISNSVAVQDNIDISYFSYDDLKPVRQIYLGAYYMDKYEVTNAVYKLCVDSGVCVLPKITVLYDNPEYSNHPVIEVDWNNANDFCKWRGTRLPTEAEWEKAARGTDGRSYPWGEGISASRTNYGTSSTMEVGSIEGGVSPYGIYDMAGKAWEWVNDWYLASYYKASPASNPLGPETGTRKVFRGGGFDSNALSLQVFARGSENPTFRWRAGGFRCALSIQE
jgi:formylglycine-generating enzyme required for sulfatase activity